MALPCGHIFDRKCAQYWVNKWFRCAICHSNCHPSQAIFLMNNYSPSNATNSDMALYVAGKEIEKQQSEIEEWEAKCKEMKQTSDDNCITLKDEIKRLNELLTDHLKVIQKKNTDIQNLRGSLSKVQNEYNQYVQIINVNNPPNSNTNNLQKRYNDLVAEKRHLDGRYSAKVKECDSLKTDVANLKANMNAWQANNINWKNKADELDRLLSLKREKCNQLESKVEKWEEKISAKQNECNDLNKQIGRLNDEIANNINWKNKADELDRLLSSKREKCNQLELKVEKWEDKISAKQNECNDLNKQIGRLNDKIAQSRKTDSLSSSYSKTQGFSSNIGSSMSTMKSKSIIPSTSYATSTKSTFPSAHTQIPSKKSTILSTHSQIPSGKSVMANKSATSSQRTVWPNTSATSTINASKSTRSLNRSASMSHIMGSSKSTSPYWGK
ncbi:unnamed protein product [Mucor hiemalis]